MKIEYFGNIENGVLKIKGRKAFDNDIKVFEGKDVCITISKKKRKRSTPSNALYWMYVTIIAAEIGVTKEEMHDLIKAKFLIKKVYICNNAFCELQGDFYVDVKTGELIEGEVKEIETIQSTATLSQSDFSNLVDDVKVWALELFNIKLPNPGESNELFT
jgi:hypothetical protein